MSDKTTPRKLLLTVGALLVLVAGGTTAVLLTQADDKKPAPSATQQADNQAPAATNTIAYDGVEGKTALELLKAKATVVTKDSDYGPYVDSINGVAGGSEGKYWAFYVNGQMAPVGADAYKTKTGDKIEWKFEN